MYIQTESELDEEAMDLFSHFKNIEKDELICGLIDDISVRYPNLKDVVQVVNDTCNILFDPQSVEALPDTYLIISIISHLLCRYYCKRLMQVLTPEGLAVHFSQIPPSVHKFYLSHQEHFCLKTLIENHQERMR